MRVPRGLACWLMTMALAGVGAPIFASASSAGSAGLTTGPHAQLETDVSGNGSSTDVGEPEIAVNPTNPNELYIDGATFSFPNPFVPPAGIADTCQGWSSENAGLSWQSAPLPPGVCDEDGVAVFGPDGTLYAGGDTATSTTIVPCGTPGSIQFGSVCILVEGQDPVLTSRDDGHTWSAAVYTMGSTNLTPNGAPFPFVPGSGSPLNTFDRPWLAMDQSTNTLYAASHNIADHEGFVTASTNEGKSFGPIYAVDSAAYPSGGLAGGFIAAAHGVLAVAYTAASAPGATCPCVIFETSIDQGATFVRHIVPLVNAASTPSPLIAADPAALGHFALTVPDSTGTENQVYVTDDFGQTWHGPTSVGEAPANQRFKPWISYGPSGQLALVWRTWHGSPNTSPYDVWAAVGRDEAANGAVFSAPVRVSSVAAAIPPGNASANGDCCSFVIADHKYLHVGWGDARNIPVGGGLQIWYGRIPLTTFAPGQR